MKWRFNQSISIYSSKRLKRLKTQEMGLKMAKCMYLKLRTKKGERYFYCQAKKCSVDYGACYGCLDREIKKAKPIKKVSKKKESVTSETYNTVFDRDKGRCALCFTKEALQLHHINGRGPGKTNNPDNCIMLCQHCHIEVVHANNKKWRPILNEMMERKLKE